MKIIKKTTGKYLSYELFGKILSFEQGKLIVDLEKEYCGADVTIDISVDKNGNIVRGAAEWYAAQINIPAKTYTVCENGIADEMGFRQITKTPDPLQTDSVMLTLWALEVK